MQSTYITCTPSALRPHFPPSLHSQRAIAALPPSTLTSEDLDALLHDECLVCYELMQAGEVGRRMPCAHVFHDNCLTTWLNMHKTCPVCRREIEVCAWLFKGGGVGPGRAGGGGGGGNPP